MDVLRWWLTKIVSLIRLQEAWVSGLNIEESVAIFTIATIFLLKIVNP